VETDLFEIAAYQTRAWDYQSNGAGQLAIEHLWRLERSLGGNVQKLYKNQFDT
jgi:hypothetical protein